MSVANRKKQVVIISNKRGTPPFIVKGQAVVSRHAPGFLGSNILPQAFLEGVLMSVGFKIQNSVE